MMRLIALSLLSILSGCSLYTPQPQPNMRANVSETLSIKMTGTAVPSAIRAMQADAGVDDSQASVRISPSIAQRLGVPLGGATSIVEFTAGGYPASMPITKGPMNGRMTVNGPASGVVTLAVTYQAAGTPITVFGMHAAEPQPAALGDADGVWVTIAARGENFAAAGKRMRAIEAAVRSIALTYRAKITVTDADANTY